MKKNEKGWKRMFGWIKAGVEGGMVKCLASYSGQKSLLRTTMKTQKKTQKYRQTENRVEFPLTADFPSPCPIQIATPSSK